MRGLADRVTTQLEQDTPSMIVRRLLATAGGVGLALAVVAAPTSAFASTVIPSARSGAVSTTTLPQTKAAASAAKWLGNQLTPTGFIPAAGSSTTPSLSDTANTILALAASGVDPSGAEAALGVMESDANTFVDNGGSDDAGSLALLILDARAMGISPTNFGGTNLVTRLLATEQTTGSNAGLFGAQDPTYDGAYRQGLALAALAAAGVTSTTSPSAISSAEGWLEGQQCPDGGWTSYITPANPCNGDPAIYAGPDTNSTALAIEGLAAQGNLAGSAKTASLAFLATAQDPDGGWGYEPNAVGAPGFSDPDSTSLVIQALISAGQSLSAATWSRSGGNPVSCLLGFVNTKSPGKGGIAFPGISGADLLATEQAIPALEGVAFPLPMALSLVAGSPRVGVAFTSTTSTTGAGSSQKFKVVGGALPTGLKLKATTGVISGTPTTAGSYTFLLQDTSATAGAFLNGWAKVTLAVAG